MQCMLWLLHLLIYVRWPFNLYETKVDPPLGIVSIGISTTLNVNSLVYQVIDSMRSAYPDIVTILKLNQFYFTELCSFPNNWTGKWFHLGFPEPLAIGVNSITGKGACVKMSKNMFLMEER